MLYDRNKIHNSLFRPVCIKYIRNIRLTYLKILCLISRVYVNIFNDAARPHDATWLSPFFVVIEFSKAMWQIRNDFKKNLPVTETRTSFERLREVNLLSCLSDGLDRLVHCLKREACAQYLTAPGRRRRRRMVRNKSARSSRPQTLRGITVTHVLMCAHWQLRKKKKKKKTVENNNPMSNHMQPKCFGRWKISGGMQEVRWVLYNVHHHK